MASVHALLLGVLGLLSVPAANLSGTLDVQPSPVLTVDQNATISYSNPDKANQIVVVDIDNGETPPTRTTVEIQLDGNGNGSTQWRVPNWDGAHFTGPDAATVTRMIVPASFVITP